MAAWRPGYTLHSSGPDDAIIPHGLGSKLILKLDWTKFWQKVVCSNLSIKAVMVCKEFERAVWELKFRLGIETL